ncbi:helix-turn-helix domain-containing protein [bacterium]|nr:helix-turn-helix domain-containing protein [bacterium]
MQGTDANLNDKAILSPVECARYMGVNRELILRWIHHGKLHASNISEGKRPRWKIRREDIEAFLAERSNRKPDTKTRRKKPAIEKRYG